MVIEEKTMSDRELIEEAERVIREMVEEYKRRDIQWGSKPYGHAVQLLRKIENEKQA